MAIFQPIPTQIFFSFPTRLWLLPLCPVSSCPPPTPPKKQFTVELYGSRCRSQILVLHIYLLIFSGSIPLDPSLAQSLEEGQAFIDLFPNSPTLDAVNEITCKLLVMESIENH